MKEINFTAEIGRIIPWSTDSLHYGIIKSIGSSSDINRNEKFCSDCKNVLEDSIQISARDKTYKKGCDDKKTIIKYVCSSCYEEKYKAV